MVSMTKLPEGYRAVVIGASGGLGAAFVDQLKSDPRAGSVVGLSRQSDPALDLTNEGSIERAAALIGARGPLHLVIDATGFLHDEHIRPEKALRQLSYEGFAKNFLLNAIGPAYLIKHFHALLPRDEPSAFGLLSAKVGSIEDNQIGGWYAYRAAKAAMNQIVKTASVEIARKWPEAVLLALHPGTVATPLSEPFRGSRDVFTPEHATLRLLETINSAIGGKTGRFLSYDGRDLPW